MPTLGPGELTLVLVAVLLVFSSGRLPSLGDRLGRLVRGERAPPSPPAPPGPKPE